MKLEIEQKEFQKLMLEDEYFMRCSAFFYAAMGEFGRMNVFAIIGAAELITHETKDGRVFSNLDEKQRVELKKRCIRAIFESHPDRFDVTVMNDEEKEQMYTRAGIMGAIKNFLVDGNPLGGGAKDGGLYAYIMAMDRHNLWDVQNMSGIEEDEEFRRNNPLKENIASEAHEDPPVPQGDPDLCCWHCGRTGHRARQCSNGGSWSYDMFGNFVCIGCRPLCYVCHNWTSSHNSSTCAYRNPDSFKSVLNCWNCNKAFAMGGTKDTSCDECGSYIGRCFNCAKSGHRLSACNERRYQPAAYPGYIFLKNCNGRLLNSMMSVL